MNKFKEANKRVWNELMSVLDVNGIVFQKKIRPVLFITLACVCCGIDVVSGIAIISFFELPTVAGILIILITIGLAFAIIKYFERLSKIYDDMDER